MRKKINKSLSDNEFVDICIDMINGAKKSVYIVAGELGSLSFPDLRMATYKASKRHGVTVKMYATEYTPITTRNAAVADGYELYIGKEGLTQHYLLVDGKNFVVSEDKEVGKPTTVGKRCGWAHYDEREKAKEIKKIFDRLAFDIDAEKITTINKKAEPLYQLLYSK